MQNPCNDNTFDADFNICNGPYGEMLTVIISDLIMPGACKWEQLTDFGSRFLEAVKATKNIQSERTAEFEREMQRYDLTVRLQEIKKDREALLDECRKTLMLETLDAPKSASTPPHAAEDNDTVIA